MYFNIHCEPSGISGLALFFQCIEKNKMADFIILNQDIMEVEDNLILETKVLETFIDGVKVF